MRLDALLLSAERIAGSLEAELPGAIERTTRAADSVADLAQRTTDSMDDVDALIAELRATAAVAREVGEDLATSGTPALDRVLLAMRDAAEELGELAQSLAANPSQLLRGRQTSPGPGEEQ
jgi:hypothetical protein